MGCTSAPMPPPGPPVYQAQPPPARPSTFSTSSLDSVAPPPSYISVVIPPGAVPGTLLRFQAPDGRMVQVQVPAGFGPGNTVSVEVPRRMDNHGFTTLLEAFQHCDPENTGCIRWEKRERFAKLAKVLANDRGEIDVVWKHLDQDGNGAVNFPEFVEWAESYNVDLPMGLEGGDQVAFPSTWEGPRDNADWNKRTEVKDAVVLAEFAALVENTYKKVWTRDRKSTGINQVPDGYKLKRAVKNENFKDWKGYYLKRHMLAHACSKLSFVQHRALTEQSQELSRRNHLRPYVNEWFLFHGCSSEVGEKICAGDFRIDMAGSATGTLYGKGTYFAESITKADEYAKEGPDGLCCVLLCRVVGGHVLYNDEVTPDPNVLQQKCLDGHYHSVLGDREKCRNTFKEYVVFDADQVYVDYILYYKRIFATGPPK